MIPTPHPEIQRLLEQAKRELAEAKAEKARLFPPNIHPFAEPDKYPKDYTPEQIAQRNALNARIESLEKRIEDLQNRLYSS
jgi:polyhydroxyalkanoate synthesis regulator phasin